uniref:Fibronectin type-III domain-containing protein n=1 Tax=Meloidogyne javanica TaxID=6303 RepID=A0A915M0Y1_MELJA
MISTASPSPSSVAITNSSGDLSNKTTNIATPNSNCNIKNRKKLLPTNQATNDRNVLSQSRTVELPNITPIFQFDRSHSVESSIAASVPLRRASCAFDHRQQHHKPGTPPYSNNHHHQQYIQQNGVPQHNHQHDSSDCGSSSGLGGMGTPVKGLSGSCSASSNNSMAADSNSHESQDSCVPISSPGAAMAVVHELKGNPNSGQNNAAVATTHRSLVASATLTQSMISSQQSTTTISPQSPHQQHFGDFIPAVTAPPSNGQQQPPPPLHFVQQHIPQTNQNSHHPSHNAIAQMSLTNAMQAAAAAAAMQNGNLGPNPVIGQPLGAPPLYCANAPPPLGDVLQRRTPAAEQQHLQYNSPHGMGCAFYTMTCENAALASVGAAAVTAGYHVTLEPSASAPPVVVGLQQQNNNEPSSTIGQHVSSSPAGSLTSSVSLPVSCAATTEGEGRGGSQQEGEQQKSQQQRCSPPPGFGVETENQCKVDEADSIQKNKQNEVGTDNSNGERLQNDAQDVEHIANGPLSSRSTENNNNNNSVLLPGIPPEIAAAINGGHDLFVHIHPGDSISLAVGNEIQLIHGPATIRMVSNSMPPTAIPMNVPHGHVVQQLLDSQGNLAHIIMSQEMPPPQVMGPAQSQIHQRHSQNSLQPQQQHLQQQQRQRSTPSPQKCVTPSLRYRSSPSSSNSPPDMQQHVPQQQHSHHNRHVPSHQQHYAALPYDHSQQQHSANLSQQQQPFSHSNIEGAGTPSGGSGIGGGNYGGGHHHQHPNPLSKWSPRGSGGFQSHQQFGRRANHNMPPTYYMDPIIAAAHNQPPPPQLLSAAHSPSTAPLGIATNVPQYGQLQQPMLLEQHFEHIQPQAQPLPQQFVTPIVPIPIGEVAEGGQFIQRPTPTAPGMAPSTFEDEEKERLRDSMSSLQPPIVTRVGDRDADVVWQELDTSEAAASLPGFPEINQSEFAYRLILYEQNASTSICYKTDANSGNVLHLQRLRPATDYMICIRADLPGHCIVGHPSAYTTFRTLCSRPDAPPLPRLMGRQQNSVSLHWRTPNCNGSPIIAYCLQMTKGKSASFDTVYEGPHDQALVGGLDHGSFYRFRVGCRNEIGHSDWSPQLNVYPEREHRPNVSGVGGPGNVKLSWNELQPCLDYLNITLEVSDFSGRGPHHFTPIPVEFYANSGTFANVTGLQSNREYRFRLSVSTANGEQHMYSDLVAVRTRLHNEPQQQPQQLKETRHHEQQQFERTERVTQQPPQQQQRTSISSFDNENQQQKSQGSMESQKSTSQQQQQYRPKGGGNQQSLEEIEAPIQQKLVKTQQQQPELKPPSCSAPKFLAITSETAKITWGINSGGGSSVAAPMFELQRVDRQHPKIYYAGSDTEYKLEGLRPVEHLQFRVRAVLLDTEGRRFEGEWSQVGSACTLCGPPTAPRGLRVEQISQSTPQTENDDDANFEKMSKKASTASSSAASNSFGHSTQAGQSINLCWESPAHLNGAPVVEYTIHAHKSFGSDDKQDLIEAELKEIINETEEYLLGSTSDTKFITPKLQFAHRFIFLVCAHNEAGASPKSEPIVYFSPPGVPDPPRDIMAEALSTSELQISWTDPANNNGMPVTYYHLNCFKIFRTLEHSSGKHRQLVSQQIVPGSQRLLIIQSLETQTEYEICLQAENSIGKSCRESVRCSTMAKPPEPPELFLAQATANTLKLKWNVPGDASLINYYYYLERENENGTYSPVYEGDLRTAKVKGLRELTMHHFRIRAALSKGTMLGTWSTRYSFQTTRQPPAPPKQAPTVYELSNDLFNFEWIAARSKDSSSADIQRLDAGGSSSSNDYQNSQIIYRLQIAPKVASSAKEKSVVEIWKTVYEGANTCFTLSIPNTNQQPRQARLFIVQQFFDNDNEGHLLDECVSAPSSIVVFSSQKSPNESPKKRAIHGGKNSSGPSTSSGGGRGRQQQAAVHYPNPKETKVTMYKRLKRFGSWIRKTASEKDCALIVLTLFVILAFGIAILLNNYYLN